MNEVWVLGATGRTARAIASALDEAGVSLALAGRDRSRLDDAARALGSAPRLSVGPLEGLAAQFAAGPPAVVINTVGPFALTAEQVLAGLPPGSHYVDVANEYAALETVLGHDGDAVADGQVLVTGAGFGVVATESIVVRVCESQPPATRVRVDALPSLAIAPGAMGSALAGSIVESLPFGRRQVRDGRLIATPFDDTPARLRTPDGDALRTANFSSGDLLAAWRASRAQHVVAASSEVPSGLAARLALPTLSILAHSPRMRRIAIDRLARTQLSSRERPRSCSWGHAWVQWPSGLTGEGWLRAGDAMDFTAAAVAEVTLRLLRGEGRPGAYTPASLFGSGVAEAAGG
ncbi:MAG: hypothetical protein M3Y22_08825, partial [Pseudomonadota bacterium]|nr:hypothetical protein [Pseudomonadota bacterium]